MFKRRRKTDPRAPVRRSVQRRHRRRTVARRRHEPGHPARRADRPRRGAVARAVGQAASRSRRSDPNADQTSPQRPELAVLRRLDLAPVRADPRSAPHRPPRRKAGGEPGRGIIAPTRPAHRVRRGVRRRPTASVPSSSPSRYSFHVLAVIGRGGVMPHIVRDHRRAVHRMVQPQATRPRPPSNRPPSIPRSGRADPQIQFVSTFEFSLPGAHAINGTRFAIPPVPVWFRPRPRPLEPRLHRELARRSTFDGSPNVTYSPEPLKSSPCSPSPHRQRHRHHIRISRAVIRVIGEAVRAAIPDSSAYT